MNVSHLLLNMEFFNNTYWVLALSTIPAIYFGGVQKGGQYGTDCSCAVEYSAVVQSNISPLFGHYEECVPVTSKLILFYQWVLAFPPHKAIHKKLSQNRHYGVYQTEADSQNHRFERSTKNRHCFKDKFGSRCSDLLTYSFISSLFNDAFFSNTRKIT
jgi:hypothetical protein